MCLTAQAEYQMKTLECLMERNYRIIDELDSLQWIQERPHPHNVYASDNDFLIPARRGQ